MLSRAAWALALLGLLAMASSRAHAQEDELVEVVDDPEVDEEGYRWGGHVVRGYDSKPTKNKYLQFEFAECPSTYDSFSFVTKIRVCKDAQGYITGLKYFSEHATRHHDPVIVCDVSGQDDPERCETVRLYDDVETGGMPERRFKTVTNIRVAKVKAHDSYSQYRIVYIAFSFSNGDAVEVGQQANAFGEGLKVEQWYMTPVPGQICGMNGLFSMGNICNHKDGLLQWTKPCGKCIAKPPGYKCNAEGQYCTLKMKKWARKHSYGHTGYGGPGDAPIPEDVRQAESKPLRN